MVNTKHPYLPDGAAAIAKVLRKAGRRPPDSAKAGKTAYAARFANAMADAIAGDIRLRYPRDFKEASASTEKAVESERGLHQLDVNFSRRKLGLGFGISLKSVHFLDQTTKNYTHNMKRNDEELRVESSGYHQRQPYAVMIGVLFLPAASLSDGSASSSFGRWVHYLRPLAGRTSPADRYDLLERVFVACYEHIGTHDLWFFDVTTPPPRKGKPKAVLSYGEFLEEVRLTYERRNRIDFSWAPEDDPPSPEIEAAIAQDEAKDAEADEGIEDS